MYVLYMYKVIYNKYFWTLFCPLIYMSTLLTIPHFLDYCSLNSKSIQSNFMAIILFEPYNPQARIPKDC